jgi:hypothetical protein
MSLQCSGAQIFLGTFQHPSGAQCVLATVVQVCPPSLSWLTLDSTLAHTSRTGRSHTLSVVLSGRFSKVMRHVLTKSFSHTSSGCGSKCVWNVSWQCVTSTCLHSCTARRSIRAE